MRKIWEYLPDDLWFLGILLPVVVLYRWWRDRQWRRALMGAAEVCLGYFVVIIGVSALAWATGPIPLLLESAFKVGGGIMNTEAFSMSLIADVGPTALLIMFAAYGVNLALARFTRAKGIFLTAHHYLYMALFTAFVLRSRGVRAYAAVPIGALLLGMYGWVAVSITRRCAEKMLGISNVGLANSSSGAALIAWAAARAGRAPEVRYECAGGRFNAGVSSMPVVASAGLFLNYVLLCLFSGTQQAEAIFSGGSWLLNCTLRALLFGALSTVLLSGIRMLISNVIELFHTLAERCSGDYWMGLDATAVLSICPAAWTAGFLYGCLGSLAMAALMIALDMPFVPLPSPSSMFFAGGVSGVCGNAYGGKRGVRLAGLLTGALSTLVTGIMAANLGSHMDLGTIFGETEYGVYGLILETLGGLIS